MANMSGKHRFPIDAALILDPGTSPFTASKTLAAWPLVSKGAYWQSPADVHDGLIYLVGKVQALTGTLSVDIYTADDAVGTNAVKYASFPQVGAGSDFEIAIDQMSIQKAAASTASYFYAVLNLGGSSPTATVLAFLSAKDTE